MLENGKVTWEEDGTPQGGVISPLLANIYLHYVFDLWIQAWRKRAEGDVMVVRYADDFVVGFQYREEAERFMIELRERLAKFGLELHPDKTRLIEFGRFADSNRQKRGEGKPDTFDFLGFTHACGKTRKGYFQVVRLTIKKRFRAKLKALKAEFRDRLHLSIPEVGKWLKTVMNGYYQYHAVPGNSRILWAFRYHVGRLWFRALKRRSQRSKLTWERMERIIDRQLPRPRILHPYPDQRLRVITQGRSPMR